MPIPPAPTRVTSRWPSSSCLIASTSALRPNRGARCCGRLVGAEGAEGAEGEESASAVRLASFTARAAAGGFVSFSMRAVKRYPLPGIVAITCGPSSLRSVLTCTTRLFSSTTSPGQTASSSSFFETSCPLRSIRVSSTSKARAPSFAALPSTRSWRCSGRTSKRPKR